MSMISPTVFFHHYNHQKEIEEKELEGLEEEELVEEFLLLEERVGGTFGGIEMDEGASFSQQSIQFLTRTNSIFSILFFWWRSWLLSFFFWLKRRWRILMIKAIWSWPTMRFFPFYKRSVFWGSTKDNISSTSFKRLEILVTDRPPAAWWRNEAITDSSFENVIFIMVCCFFLMFFFFQKN